jgi:hypothetical protein
LLVSPDAGNRGFAWDAELREPSSDHAEKPRVVIEAGFNQVVEAIRASRRKGASDFQHHETFAGVDPDAINFRSPLAPKRILRIAQCRCLGTSGEQAQQ